MDIRGEKKQTSNTTHTCTHNLWKRSNQTWLLKERLKHTDVVFCGKRDAYRVSKITTTKVDVKELVKKYNKSPYLNKHSVIAKLPLTK